MKSSLLPLDLQSPLIWVRWLGGLILSGLIAVPGTALARVFDNFDDGNQTDWTDFTFVPGFGLPREQGGQFRFELPPANQAIFTASQKRSEIFELKEDRTIEFRVDVVDSGDKDSFAVLAFIPTANSPGTLSGYGIAKSTTDVLMTKGINRYLANDAISLKKANVTLVLRMRATGGSVHVTGQILDRDAGGATVWERTVIDTPAADVMADGEDSPAAPFLTGGYFTLYCYEDFDRNAPENPYKVYYDNAEVFVTDRSVVDDFNDNAKSDWKEFTFVPGLGLPTESNGQFRFEIPPAGQSLFTAGQKTSRVFDLVEGEQLEFSVDIVESGGKDSFAILAFMPTENSPGTLSGYGFAKSTTDVLLTKGINKYFVNDATSLKQNKTRLILSLVARGGNVEITGTVLDLEADNAVLFRKTVVDTPAADVMADGDDGPAAPFLASGYFTLYCYEDFDRNAPENPYFVYFDNAVASAPPPPANLAPVLADVQPAEFANFLPATSAISFKVDDDRPLVESKMTVTLNGAPAGPLQFTKLDATGRSYRVQLSGALAADINYAAGIRVEDADGALATQVLYFDTFGANRPVIEIEDYNFGGQFIDNPAPAAEGSGATGSYSLAVGVALVDYQDSRATPNSNDTKYRPDDPIRMQHSLDLVRAKFTTAGGAAAEVYDYDVGDITANEWMNYTRTFIDGYYEVYLRQSVVNMDTGESVLEEVTGDRTQPDQATKVLGSFLGLKTGFQYRNFALTDGSGQNRVVLRLAGVRTLRLRQVTANAADGGRFQNYLVFIPTTAPAAQRATISSVAPANGSSVTTVQPVVRAVIQNRDTSVKTETVRLTINGVVAAGAKVTPDANGALVEYVMSPLPTPGQANSARVSFSDSDNVEIAADWTFVVNYHLLNAANRRPAPGTDRGLRARFVQAPPEASPLANDLQRAEDQLAANSQIPKAVDKTETIQVVNMAQDDRVSGYFEGESLVPGLDVDAFGSEDFSVEIKAWLELSAGPHRFRIVTDDGYKLSSGKTLDDRDPVVAFHNGGPANETADFVVPSAGLYPFRLVWYERGGNAFAEWSVESLNNAEDRVLVNDAASATAVRAFLTAPAATPTLTVESTPDIGVAFTPDASAVVDSAASKITAPFSGARRFYRVRVDGGGTATLGSVKLLGDRVEIPYTLAQ